MICNHGSERSVFNEFKDIGQIFQEFPQLGTISINNHSVEADADKFDVPYTLSRV